MSKTKTVTDKTLTEPSAPARRITTTYAYRPADATPDLILPTAVVGHYVLPPHGPVRGDFSHIEHSLADVGVQSPVRIHTDGVFAVLTDGHTRYRLCSKLNIPSMPVQVVPDSMVRMPLTFGRPVLEPELKEWVDGHLWAHDGHEVIRHKIGERDQFQNSFIKCACSCGARWKENA